jgi:hypothetical protein
MQEPVVEIQFSVTEEDFLHQVGVGTNTSTKDPLFKAKLGFITSYILAGVGVIFCAWLTVTRPEARHSLTPVYFLPAIMFMNGYRVQKGYRNFYAKVQRVARQADLLVLRAFRSGFSITRPGVSETNINWTAVMDVNFTADYLSISTFENTTYRIPSRYVSEKQWQALRELLTAVWQSR